MALAHIMPLTQPRHLRAHANFAKSKGIKETLILQDLKIARLCPGIPEIIDEAPGGRLHLDGRLMVSSEDGPAKFRRKLAFAGIVFVTVAITEKGELADDVVLLADGIPEGIEDNLAEAAEKAFEAMPRARRKDDATVEETLRTAVRREADNIWGKKPVCKVVVVRV